MSIYNLITASRIIEDDFHLLFNYVNMNIKHNIIKVYNNVVCYRSSKVLTLFLVNTKSRVQMHAYEPQMCCEKEILM